jgi:hypothetical protein
MSQVENILYTAKTNSTGGRDGGLRSSDGRLSSVLRALPQGSEQARNPRAAELEAAQTTREKTLALNLDGRTYGTFAEIGGGQEVARWFFAVGGAAGTLAKAISAYDMGVSDGIYGRTKRYVSRERLEAMLDLEFTQLVRELRTIRGDAKQFFAFANTVATRKFDAEGNGRGWLGIRFQAQPGQDPSQIIIHAHLLDAEASREQEALGILGVNLIHAAFYRAANPDGLVASLRDGLSRARIEIDMIKFSGPAFARVDNRLMSLQLVELGFTDAAMFTATGEVVQPSEVLYKKPILIERGDFRPATNLTLDLLERALEQFRDEPGVQGTTPVVLAEMTLRSLSSALKPEHEDFLARADILGALGWDVLVSRFEQYYQLADYLALYTDGPIGIALGLPALRRVTDEAYYKGLAGGFLESAGRLFKRSVKVYVYPTRDAATGQIHTLESLPPAPPWHHLQQLLIAMGRMTQLESFDESYLSIRTSEVLKLIEQDDPSWQSMVPPRVAEIIRAKRLFRSPRAGVL